LKQFHRLRLLTRRFLKFRGICRGLIEAHNPSRGAIQAGEKFRGICRGLIEALKLRKRTKPHNENSAASAAASLKRDNFQKFCGEQLKKFRGICRGLIEAAT